MFKLFCGIDKICKLKGYSLHYCYNAISSDSSIVLIIHFCQLGCDQKLRYDLMLDIQCSYRNLCIL